MAMVSRAGEPGTADATSGCAGRDQIGQTTTNGDGAYRFAALPPGTISCASASRPPALVHTPNEVTVTLAAGETHTVDFGDWNGRPPVCR